MKHLICAAFIVAALSLCAGAAEPPAAKATAAKSEDDKTLYAIGVILSQSVQTFDLTPAELKIVEQGFVEGAAGHAAAIDAQAYRPQIEALQRARFAAAGAKNAQAGVAFLADAAKQKGATRTASGLVIRTLTPGQGAAPKAADRVKVHYEGKLIDGTIFDSSINRGEPAEFPLNGVIPCWTEALQLMKVGGKSQIVCPAALAYGDRGSAPLIRPGSTLVFEVQLLGVLSDKGTTSDAAAPVKN